MAVTAVNTDSFKNELPQGVHNFTTTTGDVFAMALYTSAASVSAATTVYSATGEVENGNGYTTGGFLWTAAQNITPQVSGSVSYWSWSANPSWPTSSISAGGALIYNTSKGNKAVQAIDFGATKVSTDGTFTYTLPANTNTTAQIRIQ